ASEYLLKGLMNLEYRGYDSAGMAVLNSRGLEFRKAAGKIAEINARLNFLALEGSIGIAHTRWATHGKVDDGNAHPHFDCSGKIAIVHNGIIENYEELKAELFDHRFSSETDSEVVAHLVEEGLKRGLSFEEAFMHAISKLEGTFAILCIKEGERKILAARKGSPLVVGISDDATFISSDIPSFLEWTKNVIYLRDGDVVIAEDGTVRIFNSGVEVSRPVDVVEWDAEQIKKGGFEHYMLKEIAEQREVVQRAISQDYSVLNSVIDEMRRAYGIFFTACGSSYNACLAASYIFSRVANLHVNVVLASEFENYVDFLSEKTLVFAVSQSGETYDVLEAVRAARSRGCRVIGVLNRIGSSLALESDCFLRMNVGPEICVVATKTFTSQVALLAMLAYAFAGRKDEIVSRMKALYLDLYNLTSRSMREHLKNLAEKLYTEEHIYLIGRGLQYATALEAALKIKEVSYIHAEAFAAGELKHGPLALISDGTPVIAFLPKGDKRTLSNAIEVKARGGYIIGVSPERHEIFDYWIKVPECGDLNPIVQIIPMQILSYELALLRGLDPDKPRNLAKSVTVP
ncbi:MAG: glutamine--fructose-6-phosphate transaminase (isomerizing), partial [Archaeoglobi archaeon]|nr:glutamine--fructose-6-phosphate transaminase (isomerizing) [Candidatus Mnemosynella bozhongmuii]